MTFLTSLVRASARVVAAPQLRLQRFSCKRPAWVRFAQRRHVSVASDSSTNTPNSGLQRYEPLKRDLERRLRAAYKRFSNVPDHSLVVGQQHVYFVEGDGIYRADKRHGERKSEQVLNLELVVEGDTAEQRRQWTVQRIRLSPQEKHLAATVKSRHCTEPRCVVVKLRDPLPLEAPRTVFTLQKVLSFEWATDEVLFYTTLEGLSCRRVFRLDLTTSGSKISSVHEEARPDVFAEVALTRDRRLLSINSSSRSASEVRLVDVTAPSLEPLLVQPRRPDLLYHVEHWRERLIILASTGPGQEYQVVQAPLSEPYMTSWVPLFTPEPGTTIKDMDVVGNHCVLVARVPAGELVLTTVSLTNPEEVRSTQLPPWACAFQVKRCSIADRQDVFEFLLSSPAHSPVPYCLYPEEGILMSGTGDKSFPENRGNYSTTRLEAPSEDGSSVPITLVHKAPLQALQGAPLLVHVYGAYGRDLDMEFHPEKRLLVDEGWALAYCHIRGGGERGLAWHREARVERKPRGVDDLAACLLFLFSSGVSSPSLAALTACSAGAVPVGALCNSRPHLMRAVSLQAPFLDVLGTLQDPSLPLTLEDREEWGDPAANPQHRLAISSYCPLSNIAAQRYPSIMLTAYSADARVPLPGVLRYTEKLKEAVRTHGATTAKSECEPTPNIVVNIQPGTDHQGPQDFGLFVEQEALQLAFLHAELGLDPPRTPRRRRR
ncbi:prolyl endopeptidase-like [Nelusetta ayraudi]|uniref:prolyl endopeptidase-like n=1 Tax=Nelusetta ayraudi TaxID=303726 RepID=UPI003F701C20